MLNGSSYLISIENDTNSAAVHTQVETERKVSDKAFLEPEVSWGDGGRGVQGKHYVHHLSLADCGEGGEDCSRSLMYQSDKFTRYNSNIFFAGTANDKLQSCRVRGSNLGVAHLMMELSFFSEQPLLEPGGGHDLPGRNCWHHHVVNGIKKKTATTTRFKL